MENKIKNPESDLELIRDWLNRPSNSQIEKEAGLGKGYLTQMLKGSNKTRPETIDRVIEVLRKYGFKYDN